MTAPDHDTPNNQDDERADRASTEFGGAYGDDDTPMPTDTAATLGDPPRGEANYETRFTNAHRDDDEGEGLPHDDAPDT